MILPRVIEAGAAGAAHLPGMTAAMTLLPVIGVPVRSKALSGMDSLLSIAQMPAGVPVGTMAIAGLPLGKTCVTGHSAMVNYIGRQPDLAALLALRSLHGHLHGKAERPGRKVGHATLWGRSNASFKEGCMALRSLL